MSGPSGSLTLAGVGYLRGRPQGRAQSGCRPRPSIRFQGGRVPSRPIPERWTPARPSRRNLVGCRNDRAEHKLGKLELTSYYAGASPVVRLSSSTPPRAADAASSRRPRPEWSPSSPSGTLPLGIRRGAQRPPTGLVHGGKTMRPCGARREHGGQQEHQDGHATEARGDDSSGVGEALPRLPGTRGTFDLRHGDPKVRGEPLIRRVHRARAHDLCCVRRDRWA